MPAKKQRAPLKFEAPHFRSQNFRRKSAVSAASAVPSASPAAPASAAAPPAMAAASAPASATMTTASASTTASTAAFPLRSRFSHHQRTSQKILAVEPGDCLFRFGIVVNFREAEAPRLPRETIAEQSQRIRLHSDFRKQRLHLLLRSLERQISHIQFLHGRSPYVLRVREGTSFEAEVAGIRPQAVVQITPTAGEASAPAP